MATQYDIMKCVNSKCKDKESELYPKVVTYGTKTLKDNMKDAANGSGLTPAMVQGVVTMLESKLAQYLADMYYVKLEITVHSQLPFPADK